MGSAQYNEHGMYFCPSYMVGSGRRFQPEGFVEKLGDLAGYVIADVYRFPKVPYWIIPVSVIIEWWKTEVIGKTTKISRQSALRLIESLPD